MKLHLAATLLFSGFIVTFLIVYSGALATEDTDVFRALNSLASSPLAADVAILITYFGSELVLIPLALLTFPLSRTNRLETVFMAVLAVAAADLILIISKSAYVRPRPSHVLSGVILPWGVDNESSFPSGHTTRAFAFAILVSLRLGRRYSVLGLLAVGVAISRIILGVHFPLDVTGGALLGALIGLVSYTYGPRLYRSVIPRIFPGRRLP